MTGQISSAARYWVRHEGRQCFEVQLRFVARLTFKLWALSGYVRFAFPGTREFIRQGVFVFPQGYVGA
jgi:hypothetical protein